MERTRWWESCPEGAEALHASILAQATEMAKGATAGGLAEILHASQSAARSIPATEAQRAKIQGWLEEVAFAMAAVNATPELPTLPEDPAVSSWIQANTGLSNAAATEAFRHDLNREPPLGLVLILGDERKRKEWVHFLMPL